MMGPGMIKAVNARATVEALMAKDENLLYDADEIADEVAYENGWSQDDQGVWTDEDGDEVESPLDMLYQYNLPDAMQDKIVEEIVKAYNTAHPAEEESGD